VLSIEIVPAGVGFECVTLMDGVYNRVGYGMELSEDDKM